VAKQKYLLCVAKIAVAANPQVLEPRESAEVLCSIWCEHSADTLGQDLARIPVTAAVCVELYVQVREGQQLLQDIQGQHRPCRAPHLGDMHVHVQVLKVRQPC
jgi:hypothetical protein